MNRKPIRLLHVTALILVATGCTALLGPGETRRLGVIDFYQDPVVIAVPDTVQAGAAFEVSVRTYGGGCITKGDTETQVEGLTAEVRPYDLHSGAEVCTDELRIFDHRATLAFEQAGLAEVRFHGREMPADSVVTIVRSVVVE